MLSKTKSALNLLDNNILSILSHAIIPHGTPLQQNITSLQLPRAQTPVLMDTAFRHLQPAKDHSDLVKEFRRT